MINKVAIKDVYRYLDNMVEDAVQKELISKKEKYLVDPIINMLKIGVTDKKINYADFKETFSHFNEARHYIVMFYSQAVKYYEGKDIEISVKNNDGSIGKRTFSAEDYFNIAWNRLLKAGSKTPQQKNGLNNNEETF